VKKRKTAVFSVAALVLLCLCAYGGASRARAEKEEFFTSSEEFLPVGAEPGKNGEGPDTSFLEDPHYIHNGIIGGIRLLKEEDSLVFLIEGDDIEGRELKFDLVMSNFPPRFVLRLYGTESRERVFRFFKNLNIVGITLNPFKSSIISEYVVFLRDWAEVTAYYDQTEKNLIVRYVFIPSPYERGYGVRIADSMIDPIPHIAEIKRELTRYGLENHLLVASDHETVVLESPFYANRSEAVSYMEELDSFGYKGKLAIREYKNFPEPHRFDVISEAVVTAEEDIDLESLVYNELLPERLFTLSYADLFIITREIFSPRVRKDDELISERYLALSGIYANYATDDDTIRENALLISIKILEIICFNYPHTENADDAYWAMANTIRETGLQDQLTEEECYRIIIEDYPESGYNRESKKRIGGEFEEEEEEDKKDKKAKKKSSYLGRGLRALGKVF